MITPNNKLIWQSQTWVIFECVSPCRRINLRTSIARPNIQLLVDFMSKIGCVELQTTSFWALGTFLVMICSCTASKPAIWQEPEQVVQNCSIFLSLTSFYFAQCRILLTHFYHHSYSWMFFVILEYNVCWAEIVAQSFSNRPRFMMYETIIKSELMHAWSCIYINPDIQELVT